MSHAVHHSYTIDGMNSSNCASIIQNKLYNVFGVSSVKVDLENKQAQISSMEEIHADKFQDALSNTNYTIAKRYV